MAERRGGTRDAGIADENVDLAMAFMQRGAQPGDAVEIGEIEWHQRGAAAVFADLVVEFLQPALRARDGHDMRAGAGKRTGRGIADAARGAGNERDAGGEGFGHDAGPSTSLRRVLQTWMAGTSPAMTKTLRLNLCLFRPAANRRPTIYAIIRRDLHALSESKKDKPNQQQAADNRDYRLHHCASRQLASASSDSCRGCGSTWFWSVRLVG